MVKILLAETLSSIPGLGKDPHGEEQLNYAYRYWSLSSRAYALQEKAHAAEAVRA